MTHDFNNEVAGMADAGITQAVNVGAGAITGAIEANGGIAAIDVIIDGARDA